MNIDVFLPLKFNNRIFASGKYLRKTSYFMVFTILTSYIRETDGLSITDSGVAFFGHF